MTPNSRSQITAIVFILTASYLHAAGTTAGRTLLETSGARPAAMGEAFTAASDDVTAFSYNPASLKTLTSSHASFMYQKGLTDDAYGQFMIGTPLKKGTLGFSLGYYNGGNIEIFDGVNDKNVTAKKDLTASLGYAHNVGAVSLGVTGKYISSELIETNKATAFAGDIGMQMPFSSRVRFGAAIQNVGSQLKYASEGSDLPQIARVGLGISLFPNSYKSTLLLDAPYYVKDKTLNAGVGLETLVGPLALRVGYRTGNELAAVTFGAGFMLGSMSLDYSYGLVQNLDASHRVSLGLRFGAPASPDTQIKFISQKPQETGTQSSPAEITFVQRQSLETQKKGQMASRAGEVYIVKPGDSFGKIAQTMYGDSQMWKKIYMANKQLLGDSKSLEAGQRIVLP